MNKRSKPDHYTLKARKSGYPARSVYKLEEIQKRWKLIKKNSAVLDVGAAPGSWTLYVLKNFNNTSVTAVDLKPLEIKVPDSAKLNFYQGDIFSQEAEQFLSQQGPYNCILSDAAPSTTGNRLVDTSRSFDLVSRITDLAEKHLSAGGCFIVKIFQGGDEKIILRRFKNLFRDVKTFKPKAVRSDSMETYLIGSGYAPVR